LRRRVALGVQVYRTAAAPYLLLVGGGAPVTEASVMRELALLSGVPDAALICETRSRNTSENAVHSARVLREKGLHRVVLVSDAVHLFRARLLFRIAGHDVVGCAGVPPGSAADAAVSALYESLALPRSLARMLWLQS
jgi:uncharacterized SAM-binding protein YcdF (DUF218 family)